MTQVGRYVGRGQSLEKALQLLRTVILYTMAALCSSFLVAGKTAASREKPPFRPGETLTFAVTWERIPAGTAVLRVLPNETTNGLESYHFTLAAWSNSFVDLFYKVRDRMDSYAGVDMSHSVLFKRERQRGIHKNNITIEFDWQRNVAHYSDYLKRQKPVALAPGSFDPLAGFYFLRLFALRNNYTFKIPITNGLKSTMVPVRVIRREMVQLPSGTFDAYLLEPETTRLGGVFRKSKNPKIQVWLSADKRRLPVKIKIKVLLGSIICELTSFEEH